MEQISAGRIFYLIKSAAFKEQSPVIRNTLMSSNNEFRHKTRLFLPDGRENALVDLWFTIQIVIFYKTHVRQPKITSFLIKK